jgi:hypothetical protein
MPERLGKKSLVIYHEAHEEHEVVERIKTLNKFLSLRRKGRQGKSLIKSGT